MASTCTATPPPATLPSKRAGLDRRSIGIWSPDEHGAIAGLLHRIRVSSSEAEIGLVVRSDLKRNGIGESLVRDTLDRSTRGRLKTLSCVVLRENKSTLALARKVGFFPRSITAQSVEFEIQTASEIHRAAPP